jgi:hypothetical protein
LWYYYSPESVTKDYPDLLKKWEEKKVNCNMAHAKLRINKKKDEEVDV